MNKGSYNSPHNLKQKARSLPTTSRKDKLNNSSPIHNSSLSSIKLNLDTDYIPYIIL